MYFNANSGVMAGHQWSRFRCSQVRLLLLMSASLVRRTHTKRWLHLPFIHLSMHVILSFGAYVVKRWFDFTFIMQFSILCSVLLTSVGLFQPENGTAKINCCKELVTCMILLSQKLRFETQRCLFKPRNVQTKNKFKDFC